MSSGKNVSAEMKLWKDRCDNELKSAAEWEENWGFLKAPKKKGSGSQQPDSLESPKTGLSGPGGAGDSALVSGEAGEQADLAMVSAKFKCTMNRSKTPKEKYSRPITTQQEVGWRPSLELFGVARFGIKRSPDLWPEK